VPLAPSSSRRLGRVLRGASLAAVAWTLLSAAGARDARADDSVAAATVLFDEGVKLLDAGQLEEACPKLARSHALAPSGGTLLALGECYEKSGKIGSAWLAFREAAMRAAAAGKRDAEAGAIERARKLEPRLPRLTIVAPNAPESPGLEIRRDGVLLKEPELGVAVPVDPGSHDIVASAPKRKTWTVTVTSTEARASTIAVPALRPTEGASGAEGQPTANGADAPSPGSTQRAVGLVVAGVGVAGLVAGGIFGLMASSTNDDALSHCTTTDPIRCDAEGLSLTDDAKSQALVSTILFVAGGLALGAGGVLFFTAPSAASAGPARGSLARPPSGRAGLSIGPTWGKTSAGAAATLRW